MSKRLKTYEELLSKPAAEPLTFTRRSLELTPAQWTALDALAEATGSTAPTGPTAGQPTWRTLIKRIAAGDLVVSERPAYAIGQPFDFTEGERVICNGHPGTIDRVLTGQLAGMVEVRLAHGSVCVSACYPDCYPAPSAGMKLS